MVQALREIIELENFDEASLVEALSTFIAAQPEREDSKDVMRFLKEEAVNMEKAGLTRTYLIINDEEWDKNNLQIDGYFSLAIKNLYFDTKLDKTTRFEISGNEGSKSIPAYLIGQLARAEKTSNGIGKEFFKTALGYIANASDLVGGRLIYLDCQPDRQSYYEKLGFKFLQAKNKSNLIQLYMVI